MSPYKAITRDIASLFKKLPVRKPSKSKPHLRALHDTCERVGNIHVRSNVTRIPEVQKRKGKKKQHALVFEVEKEFPQPERKTWYGYAFDGNLPPAPHAFDSATMDLVLVDDCTWDTYDSFEKENLVLVDKDTGSLVLAKLSKRQCKDLNKVWNVARDFLPTVRKWKDCITRTVDGMKMYCFGYRKNPKDEQLGQYSFKPNCSPKHAKLISDFVVGLTKEMFKKAKPMCSRLPEFKKMCQAVGKFIMSTLGGTVFTQFGCGFEYWSHAHTDSDFFYTLLGGLATDGKKDVVLYYFVFPEYGIKVPMKDGDLMFFDPLQYHCCTNQSRPKKNLIFSGYSSNKSVATDSHNKK